MEEARYRMILRRLSYDRALLLGLSLSLAACGGATGPRRSAPTHPAGVLSGRVSGFTGRPFAVRVSPDDVVLVTQQDANSVARFSLGATAPELAVPVGADPGDVVFTRDGATAFASAFIGGGVHILDVAAGDEVAAVRISSNAYRLAITSDDGRLFVSSTDGRLYLFDPVGRRVVASVRLQGALQGLALSSSDRWVVVSSTSGTVWKIDAATLEVLATRTIGGTLQDVAIARDGGEIYVASETGWIDVLDGATLEPKQRITLTELKPFGLALTPDDAQLYVTSPTTGTVGMVDRQTRSLLATFSVAGVPRRVAFDASGATAVIANEGNWVDIVR